MRDSTAPRREVFPSKIDGWLAGVVVGAAAMGFTAATLLLTVTGPTSGTIGTVAAIVGLGVLLPAWIFTTTAYTVTEQELLVRSGPFRWRVPLGGITSVRPTRNPLSSPALSLDRLRIDYGDGKWIMISPRERRRFLEALEARGVGGIDVSRRPSAQ